MVSAVTSSSNPGLHLLQFYYSNLMYGYYNEIPQETFHDLVLTSLSLAKDSLPTLGHWKPKKLEETLIS